MSRPLLSKGFRVNNKYEVGFYLKGNQLTQTYRVADTIGSTFVLKLFFGPSSRERFDLEVKSIKFAPNNNLVQFVENDVVVIDDVEYSYLILQHISGESIYERMHRIPTFSLEAAMVIVTSVLKGVDYLHNNEKIIVHNGINTDNVMIDMSNNVERYKLIGFGRAHVLAQNNYNIGNSTPFYTANEAFVSPGTIQSDIFSIGVLFYHLIYGVPPWFVDLSLFRYQNSNVQSLLIRERSKPLQRVNGEISVDEYTFKLIVRALSHDPCERFQSAKDFIKTIQRECEFEDIPSKQLQVVKPSTEKIKSYGFDAVAGMQSLKDTMQHDVIDALKDRELYESYGLTIPNGILLYGPPGCGKTFFAERMSEEVGFSFYKIKPSDIQSKWVNATQGNIKQLFDVAKVNAPSIIFIDELDALVPKRDSESVSHMNTSAVNEFLAQMNNCGEDGVFIIGATNKPDSIDPAILRTGRLDKRVFIPLPDKASRKAMFELILSSRPVDNCVDISILAEITEGFVSSDIKFLCDEASRFALKKKSLITQKILVEVILSNQPSISLNALSLYSEFDDYNSQ